MSKNRTASRENGQWYSETPFGIVLFDNLLEACAFLVQK